MIIDSGMLVVTDAVDSLSGERLCGIFGVRRRTRSPSGRLRRALGFGRWAACTRKKEGDRVTTSRRAPRSERLVVRLHRAQCGGPVGSLFFSPAACSRSSASIQ